MTGFIHIVHKSQQIVTLQFLNKHNAEYKQRQKEHRGTGEGYRQVVDRTVGALTASTHFTNVEQIGR